MNPSRWRIFKDEINAYIARISPPPSKPTFWTLFALYVTTFWSVFVLWAAFCGYRELRRAFSQHVRRVLTSSKVAVGAIVGYFVFWIAWSLITPRQSSDSLFRWKQFTEDWNWLLYIYALVVPLVIWIVDKWETAHEDERIRQTQKQRVRMLDGFAPSPETVGLFSNRSIYDSIISTLSRLERRMGAADVNKKPSFQVCLLLCTPALDYGSKHGRKWGDEFAKKLDQVVAHCNVSVDICYLPISPMLGFNPMEDFLSVLANFISHDPSERPTIHQMLLEQTKAIDSRIRGYATQYQDRVTVRPSMFNIPFQIVLVMGNELKEVVVSFAGREILERGNSEQPKGFFSSDPYVVETFYRIYLDYVKQSGRMRFVPHHTQKTIESNDHRMPHQVRNFLGVIPNFEVGAGCFSPAVANSTKFTSWVIAKTLTKDDDSVLDIGSGTGVLALMAKHSLQRLGAGSARILALEPDEKSFATLQKNCPAGSGIETKRWELTQKKLPNGQPSGALLDRSDDRELTDDAVGTFKVIIADLPFVDVNGDAGGDRRFFDPNHSAHRTLFAALANRNWLVPGGRVITAFSSLGGPDDVLQFERLISESGFQIVQRVDFHESNYLWIVHIIMRIADYDRDSYWWTQLNARDIATEMPPP